MANVDVVIRTIDKSSKGLSASEKRMKKWETGILKATVAAVALGLAVKKVFDYAEKGAKVSRMTEGFESLGVSMFDLQKAAGGTVDKMTLMTATAKLVAGTTGELKEEMQKAAPALLKVARAAVILDPSIGSVAFVYESLAKGIKKNQPLLIDNANIMVKVGLANKRMAEEKGKTIEALTAEEKQLALLNDTLRAGDILIDQIGGISDDSATSFERFRASAKDLGDEIGMVLSDNITEFVDDLAFLIGKLTETEGTMAGLSKTAENFNRVIRGVTTAGLSEVFRGISGSIGDYIDEVQLAEAETEELTETTERQIRVHFMSKDALEGVIVARKDLLDALKKEGEIREGQLSLIKKIQSAEERYQDSAESITEERIRIENDRAAAIAEGWNSSTDKIKDYDTALEENSAKAAENAEDHEQANREIMLGLIERKLLADGQLDQKEFDWLIAKGVEWGIYSDTVQAEAREAFAEVERLINEIPDTKTIDVQINKTMSILVNTFGRVFEGGRLGHARGTDGMVTVPSGFPNDSFPIGLTSGEKYQVIPSGKTGGDGQQNIALEALIATLQTMMRNFPEDIKRGNRDLVEKLGRR